jgi:hypothetical protein
MGRTIVVVLVLFSLTTICIGWLAPPSIQHMLFNLTVEETILPQISGVIQYSLTQLRPPLQIAGDVPVRYADVNPYGVNTFLQNEVEPE